MGRDNAARNEALTATQQKALNLMLEGYNDAETARECEVTRNTVGRWRKNPGPFRDAYLEAWRDMRQGILDEYVCAARDALRTLRNQAKDGNTQAAIAILNKFPLAWTHDEPGSVEIETD